MMKDKLYIILIILITLYSFLLSYIYNPIWVIVMVSAGIAYGFMSNIVSVRKLYFLAGASPHAALFAVVLSIPIAYYLFSGAQFILSIIIGLLLIYLVGYSIYKGINTDIATAVFVGFTAAGSVIVAYYVLINYPIEFDLTALILGDPLLTSFSDALIALTIAAISGLLIILTYREQLSIGINRESAYLAGINVKIYDLVVFTLLGLTAIGLLRMVGYILEHVLILLPASIALSSARSAYQALRISVLTALTASLIGLHLGIIFDLAPSGLTGLILLIYYLLALIGGKR
ncbi:ABC-3 protein [Staphylothermus marinus F1]|uniref:ABC-3 protein n=1 Tax=Staphylothermus marinus (strain ATCC 43588 / DSM 3639 / JCM 9404 / F1) TaxID=399550 RepID=A3DLG7_STAMF|nr:metal ABC transporter permease [Staphylothermus marinus]ABN69477.1 ABC-3 protein [Staphylothermus marinus F1]